MTEAEEAQVLLDFWMGQGGVKDQLLELAKMVVLVRRAAVLEEREACAKVADGIADAAYRRFEILGHDHKGTDMTECLNGRCIAAAIRARGQS